MLRQVPEQKLRQKLWQRDVVPYPFSLAAFSRPVPRSISVVIGVGIAYFLAARLSLVLLTKPDGVAVFWPAAGVSAGALIALGPTARWQVVAGAAVATVAANLLGDRNIWSALVFAASNAAEVVLVAGLIGGYFGPDFNLDKLRNVLGLLAAAIIGTSHIPRGRLGEILGPATATASVPQLRSIIVVDGFVPVAI